MIYYILEKYCKKFFPVLKKEQKMENDKLYKKINHGIVMINQKEIGSLALIMVVLAISISLFNFSVFLGVLLAVFLILLINSAAKKIAAYYLDSEIEIKPWQIQRYGLSKKGRIKGPIPIGVFLPVLLSLITVGNFAWMASLVFDIKPKIYRAAKRHGLYSFSEITESHIGMIAAVGILVSLLAAVVGYLLGFPIFARLSIYYAFFNMIPIFDLDGNKIFFGNVVNWSFLATLVLIGLGYAFFLT